MHRLRVVTLGAMCIVGSCGENSVVLSNDRHTIQLSYACNAIMSQAAATAELALVRQEAGRVMRYEEERGRAGRIEGLSVGFQALDDQLVEQALVEYGCRFGIPDKGPARFPEMGSSLPGFSLPLLGQEDRRIELGDHEGSIVVLNFWATWCVPCKKEVPELVELARQYADSGVVVYGILKEDSPAAARAWLQENGHDFPTLIDADGGIARAYMVRGIPHTFIVSAQQTLVRASPGHMEGKLKEMISEALRTRASSTRSPVSEANVGTSRVTRTSLGPAGG